MSWPSTLTTFTDPNAGDKLNSPSHSAIETDQNTALEELQNFIGTESSTVGTLFYDVRAAASNGGGHVQTANKGGTGQTAFTKGDVLVASSASVLSKLAIGSDNQVLTADSSVATGVKWGNVATSAQIQNQAFTFAQDGGTASVYAIYPTPCVVSYTAGQMFAVKVTNTNSGTAPALSVSSLVAKTIKHLDGTALSIGQIPSSTFGLFGYDGSVFQYLNPLTILAFKNGTATRAGDAASGDQTIAHGLGKAPRYVRISAYKNYGATTNANIANSLGVYNGTTTSGVRSFTNVGGSAHGSDVSTNMVEIYDTGSALQVATIAVDATNITLTWTKTGAPNSAAINMVWEAQA